MFLHCSVDGMLWVGSCRMKQSPVYNLEPVFCQPVQRSGRRIKASKLRLMPPKTVGTKKNLFVSIKKKEHLMVWQQLLPSSQQREEEAVCKRTKKPAQWLWNVWKIKFGTCVCVCVFACFVNSSKVSDFIVLLGSPLIFHSWHFLVIPTAAQDLRCLTL